MLTVTNRKTQYCKSRLSQNLAVPQEVASFTLNLGGTLGRLKEQK